MIYLLRHTRPDISSGICYGITDLELHLGQCEADLERARQSHGSREYRKIYSSPLKRCLLLARTIANDKKIVVDERLKEMDFGEWEMVSWEDIFTQEMGKQWFDNYIDQPAPGGESFRDMIAKAKSFLDENKGDDDILVVTHAGFIRAAMVAAGKVESSKAFDVNTGYGEVVKLEL